MKTVWLILILGLVAPALGWAEGYGSYSNYQPTYSAPRVEYVTRYVNQPVTQYVDRVVTRQVASNSGDGGERRVAVRGGNRGGSYGFNVSRGGGNTNNGYSGSGGGTSSPHRGDYEAYLRRLQEYRQQVERRRPNGALCGNYLRRPEDCKTVAPYDATDDVILRSWPN